MSSEICKLCDKDSTPWYHINGYICKCCYMNAIGVDTEERFEELKEAVNDEIHRLINPWISVKDKLPDKTMSVLICNGSFIDIAAYLIPDYFITDKGCVLDATHWMPLPDMPI